MKPQAVTTRRRFFLKAGAALSAPLAVATAHGSGNAGEDTATLYARLALLEDMSAIRDLNLRYAQHVNARERAEIARLFADPADAPIDDGIRGIAAESFAQDAIQISADRTTATARLECEVVIETPIEPRCPLVDMALEQGGGVVKRSERGVLENAYVKRSGIWKIRRMIYTAV
jgi:hypothetical protein